MSDLSKGVGEARKLYEEGSSTRRKWLIFGAGVVVALVLIGLFRVFVR